MSEEHRHSMACRDDSNRSLCAYRLLAMSDHPPPRPKMPSLPPPRPPSTKPAANVAPAPPPTSVAPAPPPASVAPAPASRSTGSSEIPPPIVFPDAATPPLGIPRVKSFESHPLNAIRDLVPSWQQWRIAAVCVLSAAAVGFAVGRSSAPTASRASSATSHDPSCPGSDAAPYERNCGCSSSNRREGRHDRSGNLPGRGPESAASNERGS